MCTQRNRISLLNMAIGCLGGRLRITYLFQDHFLNRNMVIIIILHTYTVLYIQETSKDFTNYFAYPQGSHFLGKEVSSDKNWSPVACRFRRKFNGTEWEGRSCSRSPQLLLALKHPSSLCPLPTGLCSSGIRVKNVNGRGEQEGQLKTRTT